MARASDPNAPRLRFSSSAISVIVPVFNEGDRIQANLDLLIDEVSKSFANFEILVMNDGSTDQTDHWIRSYIQSHPDLPIRLSTSEKNLGKGRMIREGFRMASGDYIFFIDGGMELHPRELRIFFGLLALYEADIVVGSKRHPQSEIVYPWYRRLLSRLYQELLRRLFDLRVTDTQVGMKLFRRDVVLAIMPLLQIDRYGFDLEALAFARALGFKRILEAPIQLNYFTKERNVFKDLLHVLRVGTSLVSDTFQLYKRVQSIRR